MKKYLLLASSAMFLLSANAQDRSKAVFRDMSHLKKIDNQSTNILVKETNIPNDKAGSTVALGTSFNIYGVLGDRQNQVVYNKDINTVAFVHRQNDGGPGGTNATGIMSLDYSTDGGSTWTINPYQTTPTGSGADWGGNRYPNMGIYNPAANTDPANAFMVQAGPTLETGAASNDNGWAKTFRSSFKLDGTLLDETYDYNSVSSQGNINEWGVGGLYVTSQGTAWYVSTNSNNSGETPNPAHGVADDNSAYFIVRGDFNTGANKFDWTVVDTIAQTWNTTDNDGNLYNLAGLPNMAWSVDGNTGYVVIMGSWGANTMTRPYVMKTVDAGTTWNNVNDFDFSTDPVMQQYIFPLNSDGTTQRPNFTSFDVVVDSTDELRIFGEVNGGFSDHPDSLGFVFGARQAGYLFEVATNGANWDVTFIDSIYVDDFEWDGAEQMSHFVRPQASRSQDGSKVFYSWIGSNSLLATDRQFPDVWAISHDISGTEATPWSAYKNLSAGTSASFVSAYQTVAVDAIENGSEEDWELAIVYATGQGGSALSSALSAPQWNFLKGVGFSTADFTTAGGGNSGGQGSDGNVGSVVGVEEEVITSDNITLYPNPSNGIITLRVANTNDFNYTVIDVVGNVVNSKHVIGNTSVIDLTNNAKGIYFVNINNGISNITKKVILSK